MNSLEAGTYIPQGETDEILEHLKGLIDSETNFTNEYVTLRTTSKNTVWDHPHFSVRSRAIQEPNL